MASRGSACRRCCAGRAGSCSAGTRSRARSTGCCRAAASTSGETPRRRAAPRARARRSGIDDDVPFEGPVAIVDSIAPATSCPREARRAHHLRGRPLGGRSLEAVDIASTRPCAATGCSASTSWTRSSCTRRSSASSARWQPGRPGRVPRRRSGPLRSGRRATRARSAETACACALELVGRAARSRRLAACVRERLREQPVGEPRVARQQRAVEVRADHARRRGSPRSPLAPSLPKPATTRPSGSAPSSRIVRPAWFSNPASVCAARPARTRAARRRSSAARPATVCERQQRRRRAARRRSGRGRSGRAAGSRRRPRGTRRRPRRPRAARSPCAARSGATSACSRSCPPPT